MNKLYVATDFSDGANAALNYAIGMAIDLKWSIEVVHAYETPLFYTADMPYTAIEAAENITRSEAERKIKELESDLHRNHPNLQIHGVTKRGLAADVLADLASPEDIIVTGATGANAVERVFVGTTTTSIINKAVCNVIIVPAKQAYRHIKSVVYTTDLNPEHIRHANKLSEIPLISEADFSFLFIDHLVHTDSEVINKKMILLVKNEIHLKKASAYVCTDANIADGIKNFVKEQNADLLAMVPQKRSFPAMLWHKSVTKQVSYHPDIPVLIIHTEE